MTFYYCNSVMQNFKDASIWSYIGFPALCGHLNGSKCKKIFLSNSGELKFFHTLRANAINRYNQNNENDKFNWSNILKLELVPDPHYKNTYSVVSCDVHKGRFCPAK